MKTQVERSIAYWCDGDTQNFHRTSLLASGLNPTDGPTLEAIASAYTRQQLGDIAYNAVTTLVDPIDLYLWRALADSEQQMIAQIYACRPRTEVQS